MSERGPKHDAHGDLYLYDAWPIPGGMGERWDCPCGYYYEIRSVPETFHEPLRRAAPTPTDGGP